MQASPKPKVQMDGVVVWQCFAKEQLGVVKMYKA